MACFGGGCGVAVFGGVVDDGLIYFPPHQHAWAWAWALRTKCKIATTGSAAVVVGWFWAF